MEKIDSNKRKRAIQAINLLEELSWLVESKRIVDLKEAPKLLREVLEMNFSTPSTIKYAIPNPNKNYLIGTLPPLFQDSDLFKTNVDLAEFAESILRISINRAEKRSRYELIGLIVCEVTYLDDFTLTNLVDALSKIAGNNERLKQIREAKKEANFSWNDTIKSLSEM